jgi:hypothetical protein
MKLMYKDMIRYREIIPEHIVFDAVYGNIIHERYLRGVTQMTGQGCVAAVNAEYIYLAFPCLYKMLHTVMHSIEESFPVERAALEYDG